MGYLIAQIVLCIVAAFALGLCVGWLLFRRRPDEDTAAELVRTRAELEEAQAALRDAETSPPALEAAEPEAPEAETPASGEAAHGTRPTEAAFLDDDPLPASPPPTAWAPVAAQAPARDAAQDAAAPEAADPAPATYDDLKRISGIGPAIERQLAELGVTTYRQIARFSDEDIERVGQHADFLPDRIRREGWVVQAAALHREVYGTQP